MRVEKELRKEIKRIIVGILVTALLVTLLPFENMGSLILKAAESTNTGLKVFTEYGITAEAIEVADEMSEDGTTVLTTGFF